MADSVALLGVKGGPAIRPGSAMPTSSLVTLGGRRIVVDCGLGVTRGLVDQGMLLADLDMIVLTHLHSDHCLELGPLLHTAWTAGMKRKTRVFGPPGTAALWAGFCAAMAFDIDLRISDEGRPDLRTLVCVTEYGDGTVVDEGELRIDALRNNHPPIVETYSLRLSSPQRSVSFTGDTAPFPPLVDFCAGSDLLVAEAILLPAVEALVARVGNGDDRLKRHIVGSHLPAAEAGRIASAAGVRALALHHLIPSDDPSYGEADWVSAVRETWKGPLHIGRDGLCITL